MRSYDDFKQKLKIALENIDDELIFGAFDQQEIVEQSIAAGATRDRAHSALKEIDASLSEQIRDEPTRFGMDKGRVTEARVTAAINGHPEHTEASKLYEDAKSRADEWSGLVGSWQRKQSNMRQISDLIIAGFSSTTTNTPSGDTVADAARRKMTLTRRPLSNL